MMNQAAPQDNCGLRRLLIRIGPGYGRRNMRTGRRPDAIKETDA